MKRNVLLRRHRQSNTSTPSLLPYSVEGQQEPSDQATVVARPPEATHTTFIGICIVSAITCDTETRATAVAAVVVEATAAVAMVNPPATGGYRKGAG